MNKFFGSKLNTVLLLVLIVLMVFAVKIMLKDKATYLPFLTQDQKEDNSKPTENNVEVSGRKEDLVSFSILPGSKVHGIVAYTGVIKGGYFFEANIVMHILNSEKHHVVETHGTATTEWMTAGPVTFSGTLDFSSLPAGPAYIQIHNDNASGLPENDKSITIPVVVE